MFTFIKFIPAGIALKVPALAPAGKLGNGLASPSQKGSAKVNVASGAIVIFIITVKLSGQAPVVTYSTEYAFTALALKSISPVTAFIVIPPGDALNAPPGVPAITGVGSVPV